MARQREEEVKVLVNEEAEDEGPLCAVSPLPGLRFHLHVLV